MICLLLCTYSISSQSRTADIFDLGAPYFETVLQGNYDLPTITDLAQGQDGLIWIATYEGLYQFDGYQVIPAPYFNDKAEQFPNHWVRKISVGPLGKIWVGTAASGLYVLEPRNRSFTQYDIKAEQQNSSPSINRIIPLNGQEAWLATSQGLFRYHLIVGKQQAFTSEDDGLSATVISALLLDNNGRLWFGSTAGVDRLKADGTGIEAMFRDNNDTDLSQQTLTKIFQSRDGAFWFGTFGKGAYRRTLSGQIEKLATDDWVKDIIQLPSGEIWISTARSGIQIFDAASGQLIGSHRHSESSEASFDSDNAGAFLLDRSGLLWISTLGKGLSRINIANYFSRSLAHSPGDPKSLSHNDIYAIFEDRSGLLWFSTYGKGIDIFDPNEGKVDRILPAIGEAAALQEGTVKAITQSVDGSIWLGGLNSGLYRIKDSSLADKTLERFTTKDGLFSNKIFRLFPEASGDVLVVTRRGINRFVEKDNRLVTIRDSEFSKTAALYYKAYMSNGDLWLGGPGALFYLPQGGDRLHRVTLDNALAEHLQSNRILALHRVNDDEVILVSQSSWFRLSLNPELISIQSQKIPGDTFNNVEAYPGPDGRYWGANFVFDFKSGKTQFLSHADGVYHRIRRPMASTKTRKGSYIFGGANGISIIKPAQFKTWDYQPPLIIDRIDIDGKALMHPGNALSLAPNNHGFSVSFSALDYSDPHRIMYAYRLLGYDENWTHTDSARRIATYTNLNPGDYELQVRASNRLGEWSPEQLSIPVSIAPAWYETLIFRITAAALSLGFLYVLFYLRLRHLEHRRRVLEQVVDQRTQELSESLDTLQRTQAQLVASEKHASLGRLVRGMAHELNTPLGVVSMASSVISDCSQQSLNAMSDSEISSREQLARKLSGAEKLMQKNLQRLNQLISNFKLLAGDEHEEEPRQIVLHEVLEKVLSQLQGQFIERKIKLFIDGPEDFQLHCREISLFHVLKELIQNALEHAFDTEQENAAIHITYEASDEQLRIRISDNGRGIEPELIEKVFDPFVAANANHVGLGLHAAFNNSSQQLKGEISCQNQEQGCRFELLIPLQA
ncbi:sensor histidine kinase [Pseudoteredinibacter isoporae]